MKFNLIILNSLIAENNYITASCTISNNIICKNEKKIFENKKADLPGFLLSIYNYFNINYPRFYKMDNLCKLGWLTSEILLKDEYKAGNYLPQETAIVLANASSSLDTDIKYFDTVKDIPSPSLFVYTLPNIMTGEICIRNNFKGENAFFVFDNFDTDFMEQYINNLMDHTLVGRGICGWVELLEETYKAVLFLVEKEKRETFNLFSVENMNKIFEAANR